MRVKHQFRIRDASPDRQPKIQSSLVKEILQGIMQTNNDRFKTEVCTCSQFPTEAMHRIKEVVMVDSVDDLKSSSSVRESQMPNLEVLDARIASALSRIIHNSHFKKGSVWRNRKPKKRTVPSRKTDRLPDLRSLPGH